MTPSAWLVNEWLERNADVRDLHATVADLESIRGVTYGLRVALDVLQIRADSVAHLLAEKAVRAAVMPKENR